MPRKEYKIVKANTELIIIEASIGADYRFAIPKAIRHFLNPEEKVEITFRKLGGEK